ncbi:DNA topoisomerase 3-alpha [Bienertia sinuspersici]
MSQASTSSANSKVRCSCGNYAVVRTVRNGPDVGTKFYGCPKWPHTTCQLFVPVDDKSVVEDLQLKLMEKDTTIAELEMHLKFNENRLEELVKKNKDLAEEVDNLKTEMWEQKMGSIQSQTNLKHLSMGLFVALIAVFLYCKI